MKTVGFAILVFLASFIACWIAAAFAAIAIGELVGVSQAEGAYAMGAFFMIGPALGLIGAIAITVFAIARRKRRQASTA